MKKPCKNLIRKTELLPRIKMKRIRITAAKEATFFCDFPKMSFFLVNTVLVGLMIRQLSTDTSELLYT